MKKFAMSLLTAGLLISSGLQAQEIQGGNGAGNSGLGGLSTPTIAAGVVAGATFLGVIANSSGSTVTIDPPVECPAGQTFSNFECTPDPTCSGDDELVDGVCIGTTTTVTVTASGAGTTTITVPVTFTYMPSVAG